MSNNQIITKKLNVTAASQFVSDVQSTSSYYVFAAKHTQYTEGSDQSIPVPVDTVDAEISIYDDMIFGKKILPADVVQMIPRYDWTSGTSYTMYDDTDGLLYTKQYYASVNVGSQTHVYKCLYNGGNVVSVVEPSGTDPLPFETPEDGYVWKYMYTANSYYMDKFATSSYMPVVVNTAITQSAISGAIDVIAIEDPGVGYNAYFIDEFRAAEDINIGGSGYLYGLGAGASSTDDYYNGCIIKITSGLAKDEYRYITDYYVENNQKIIVLDDAFAVTPQVTDGFEIYPYVYVFDSGGQKQTNCIARAIIDPLASNCISKVEILENGSGYRAANVTVGSIYTSAIRKNVDSSAGLVNNEVSRSATYSDAVLRAIIAPQSGHGADVYHELGANYVAVATKFIENEAPLPVDNDYRIVGLVKDPLYANVVVQVDTAGTVGSFVGGELIYQYTSARVVGTASVTSLSTTVTGVATTFTESIDNGDRILISSGTANFVSNVADVVSDTSLTLSDAATFNASDCTVSVIKDYVPFGYLSSNTLGEVSLTNVYTTNISTVTGKLLGSESYCTSPFDPGAPVPVTIGPNNRPANNFYTYNQLTAFIGNKSSVISFDSDEVVTQDAAVIYSEPSARFHSGNDTHMYVTNVSNIFRTAADPGSDGVITGVSGAQFTVTTKYSGEIVPDSGEVLFIDHLSPITRATNQSETVKLIIQF
jgi:hypothetical protein